LIDAGPLVADAGTGVDAGVCQLDGGGNAFYAARGQ